MARYEHCQEILRPCLRICFSTERTEETWRNLVPTTLPSPALLLNLIGNIVRNAKYRYMFGDRYVFNDCFDVLKVASSTIPVFTDLALGSAVAHDDTLYLHV